MVQLDPGSYTTPALRCVPSVIVACSDDAVGLGAADRLSALAAENVPVVGPYVYKAGGFTCFGTSPGRTLSEAVDVLRAPDAARDALFHHGVEVVTTFVRVIVVGHVTDERRLDTIVSLTSTLDEALVRDPAMVPATVVLQPVLLVEPHLQSSVAQRLQRLRRRPWLIPRRHAGGALDLDDALLAAHLAEIAGLLVDGDLTYADRLYNGDVLAAPALYVTGRSAQDSAELAAEYVTSSIAARLLDGAILGLGNESAAAAELERLKTDALNLLGRHVLTARGAIGPAVRALADQARKRWFHQVELLRISAVSRDTHLAAGTNVLQAVSSLSFAGAAAEVIRAGGHDAEAIQVELDSLWQGQLARHPGAGLDGLTALSRARAAIERDVLSFQEPRGEPPELRIEADDLTPAEAEVTLHPEVFKAWVLLLAVAGGAFGAGVSWAAVVGVPVLVVAALTFWSVFQAVKAAARIVRRVHRLRGLVDNYVERSVTYLSATAPREAAEEGLRTFLAIRGDTVRQWRALVADLHAVSRQARVALARRSTLVQLDNVARLDQLIAAWAAEARPDRSLTALLATLGRASSVTGVSAGWLLANATDAHLEQASLAVAREAAVPIRPLADLVDDPERLLDDLQRGQPLMSGIEYVLALPVELLHSALHQAAEARGLTVRPRLRERSITLALFITAPDLPLDLPELATQAAQIDEVRAYQPAGRSPISA